jgi:hypothetical protein
MSVLMVLLGICFIFMENMRVFDVAVSVFKYLHSRLGIPR